MAAPLLAERPTSAETHPELVAMQRQFQAWTQTPAHPTILAQGYNVSAANSPAGPVLPSPYGCATAWELVTQSGDPGCVQINWEGGPGFMAGCTLTWLHPGQTTVTLNSVSTTGVVPIGEYQLLFTIVAC